MLVPGKLVVNEVSMDESESRTMLRAEGAKQKRVSQLEPYWAQLVTLRIQGFSFRTLVDVLSNQADISVTPATIHKFLEVRKNRQPEAPEELAPQLPVVVGEREPVRVSTAQNSERRRAAVEKIQQVAKRQRLEQADLKFKYSEEPLQFEK